MKTLLLIFVSALVGCASDSSLLVRCENVHALSLRNQMGCPPDTDARSALFLQCQSSCDGRVDRETTDRCLARCDHLLEEKK